MGEDHADDSNRPFPPTNGGDLKTLLGFLDYQRGTFAWKCADLSDDQLRIALPPSSMTLGGMLKHLAAVEDGWFTEVVGGAPVPEPWASHDPDVDPDWEWRSAAEETGDELRSLWAERVDRSRAVVAARLEDGGIDALDRTHPAWLGRVSLRWVIFHMIEEYARHNGHADLIRESIDGRTGE